MSSNRACVEYIKLGFHVPGVMAAATSKGIELGEPRRKTIRIVKSIQNEIHGDCPDCGTRSGVDFSAGMAPEELYELAQTMSYQAFYDEVERRYSNITFTCPACGFHGGRLTAHA